jgi:hypothetical protein
MRRETSIGLGALQPEVQAFGQQAWREIGCTS